MALAPNARRMRHCGVRANLRVLVQSSDWLVIKLLGLSAALAETLWTWRLSCSSCNNIIRMQERLRDSRLRTLTRIEAFPAQGVPPHSKAVRKIFTPCVQSSGSPVDLQIQLPYVLATVWKTRYWDVHTEYMRSICIACDDTTKALHGRLWAVGTIA